MEENKQRLSLCSCLHPQKQAHFQPSQCHPGSTMAGWLQNLQSSKLLGNSHLIGEHLTTCGAFLSIQPWGCAGHCPQSWPWHQLPPPVGHTMMPGSSGGLRPSACPGTIVTPVPLGTGILSGVTSGPNPMDFSLDNGTQAGRGLWGH